MTSLCSARTGLRVNARLSSRDWVQDVAVRPPPSRRLAALWEKVISAVAGMDIVFPRCFREPRGRGANGPSAVVATAGRLAAGFEERWFRKTGKLMAFLTFILIFGTDE